MTCITSGKYQIKTFSHSNEPFESRQIRHTSIERMPSKIESCPSHSHLRHRQFDNCRHRRVILAYLQKVPFVAAGNKARFLYKGGLHVPGWVNELPLRRLTPVAPLPLSPHCSGKCQSKQDPAAMGEKLRKPAREFAIRVWPASSFPETTGI